MKKNIFPAVLMVLTVLGSAFPIQDRVEILSLPKTAAVCEAVARLHLDLLAEKDGRVFVVAPPEDLQKIVEAGLPYRLETPSFAPAIPAASEALLSSPIGAFHTYQELRDDLSSLESRFPEIARIVMIGTSLENRPIPALKISDHPEADESEAAVLFLGCHHAREWISVEVPFLLGKYLLENYASDPEIRALVDNSEIWIVPMVNPDGHDYTVRVYRYWRKNRRANDDGSYGVDLNRNYGFAWGYDNIGSDPEPVSEVYRGKSAFSEPETRAVRDLVLRRNFGSMISYHSYQQVVLFPWGYENLPTAQEQTLAALGTEMAGLIKDVNGRIYQSGRAAELLYATNGDTTDWTYALTGMPSFTIELPPENAAYGGFFNAEQDIASIFSENLPAMLYLVSWTIEHPNPVPEFPFSLRFPRRPPPDVRRLKR